MDELGHSCAFTGHRPYKLPWKDNEQDPRCVMLMRRLYDQIAALAGRGVTDYYSGMAEGTDLWAALAVLKLKKENPTVRLHCIIPYHGQPDKWGARSQDRYFRMWLSL